MSAALVEPVVEIPKTAIESPKLAPAGEAVPSRVPVETVEEGDPHPLVPVFMIGGIALLAALAFVGSIVMWLLVRHTGVMAP
jgi:hypothetical protein